MTTFEQTAFWLTLFAFGSAFSLAFVIFLIRAPLWEPEEDYEIDHMVDNSEQQRTIITRGDNTTEI